VGSEGLMWCRIVLSLVAAEGYLLIMASKGLILIVGF
jgi:hypothetical protein